MWNDYLLLVLGAVLGAGLSLGTVRLTAHWDEKGARRKERAEWVEVFLENKAFHQVALAAAQAPSSGELDEVLKRVPPVPYAIDVMHDGAIAVVFWKLRKRLARAYEERLGYTARSEPTPAGWWEYEDDVRDDLHAWVVGKKKPSELFLRSPAAQQGQ